MILLLDTHAFIWWTSTDRRLGQNLIDLVGDPTHLVLVSPVSVLEIATKRRIGKLRFQRSITSAIETSGFQHLPILSEDAEIAGELSWDHKDPFDRLLVAQAIRRGATLVTADAAIRAYGTVPILWAG
jgi:PIN domain nuclease of toxin-antitoxin system